MAFRKISFMLFFLMFASVVFAIDIAECRDLNGDYWGQTLTLTQDFNSDTTSWSNTGCFKMTESGAGQNITIDCQGHVIDTFKDDPFFTTNSQVLDTLTVKDCNFIVDYSNVRLFSVNRDMNYFNFIDNNYSATSASEFFNTTATDSTFDLNASGSVFFFKTITGLAEGFDLTSSKYNRFTVTDMNVQSLYSSSGLSRLIYLYGGITDINYFSFLNSNIITGKDGTLLYLYDISDSFIDIDFNGTEITFLNTTPNEKIYVIDTSISYTKDDFIIRNLNINLNTGNSAQNSDFIDLRKSTFGKFSILNSFFNVTSSTSVIGLDYIEQSPIADLNFSGTNIMLEDSSVLFHIIGSNDSSYYNIHDLNATVKTGLSLFFVHGFGTHSYVNLYDSNLFFYDNNRIAYTWGGGDLDLNLYNNKIYANPTTKFSDSSGSGDFLADFNTVLNKNNKPKRSLLINDNSSATGGNIWLSNSTGQNLCTTDNVSPFGICDHNITFFGFHNSTTPIYYNDFLSLISFSNSSPDVNLVSIESNSFSKSLPVFSYIKDGNLTIDFNVTDPDARQLYLDLNFSSNNAQGTGKVIVQDLNLTTPFCEDFNFLDSTRCSYDFNISPSLVSDGNYYILVLVNDGVTNDFNSFDNSFMVDNTKPNVTADYNYNWQNFDANVLLSCTDVNSGCSNIYYRVDTDSSSGINYGSWQVYDANIFFSSDGNYALDFNAIDNAGIGAI